MDKNIIRHIISKTDKELYNIKKDDETEFNLEGTIGHEILHCFLNKLNEN